MRPLTEEDVRASFVNATDDELRLLALPSDFVLTDWDHLDFLAWRDPRTRGRGYVIVELDGRPIGIVLRGAEGMSSARSSMCNLCHTMQPADQVSLFTARKAGNAGAARRQRRHLHLRRSVVPRDGAPRSAARAERGAGERRPQDRRDPPAHRGLRRVRARDRGQPAVTRVVVVGDALIDELRDDTGVREFVGGAALNVAVGLSRLGVPTTLIAMVGDDEAGAHIRAYLARLRRRADRLVLRARLRAGGEHPQRRRVSRSTCSTTPRRTAASASARASRPRWRMPRWSSSAASASTTPEQTERVRRRARRIGRPPGRSTRTRDRGCSPTRAEFVRGFERLAAGAALVKVGEDDATLLYGEPLDALRERLVEPRRARCSCDAGVVGRDDRSGRDRRHPAGVGAPGTHRRHDGRRRRGACRDRRSSRAAARRRTRTSGPRCCRRRWMSRPRPAGSRGRCCAPRRRSKQLDLDSIGT